MKKMKKKDMFWGVVALVAVVFFFAGAFLSPTLGLFVDEQASSICERATNDVLGEPSSSNELIWLETCNSCCDTDWSNNKNQLSVCKEKCSDAVYGDPAKPSNQADEVAVYEFKANCWREYAFNPAGWISAMDGLTVDGDTGTGATFDFANLGSADYASIKQIGNCGTSAIIDYTFDLGKHDADLIVQCYGGDEFVIDTFTGKAKGEYQWFYNYPVRVNGDCSDQRTTFELRINPI